MKTIGQRLVEDMVRMEQIRSDDLNVSVFKGRIRQARPTEAGSECTNEWRKRKRKGTFL